MNENGFKSVLLVLCLMTLSITGLGQSIILDIPEISLAPNTANQTFDIVVQNNSGGNVGVNGILFNLQIADGGPDLGGSIDGPVISDVDIVSGTVFEGVNNAPGGTLQFTGGQLYNIEVDTLNAVGNVDLPTGSSKIAAVTFDTTGFMDGVFTLTANTLNGTTRFTADGSVVISPTLVGGSITVVPEPGEIGGIAGFLLGAFLLHRRNRLGRDLQQEALSPSEIESSTCEPNHDRANNQLPADCD